MPWIKNYDQASVYNGFLAEKDNDFKKSSNTVLIQIFDPGCRLEPPKVKDMFKSVYQFEFLDIEEEMEGFEKYSVTSEDSKKIRDIIMTCLETETNVIVHCFAGVSRSGAIVEYAVSLGFEDKEIFRSPNKNLLEILRKV